MMIKTLTEQVYFQTCNNFNTAIADGEFPASGSYIDVGDYERFAFIIRAGTLNSALTVQVQQAAAIDSTAKDITGAVTTVAASGDDGDNSLHIIEVETRRLDLNNGYNFVTLDITGAAGSDDYADILFVGINPHQAPVTQTADTTVTVFVGG
jgi:hypothetical protein